MTGRNGKTRRTKPRHTELQRSENEIDSRAAAAAAADVVSPPTVRTLRLDPSCRFIILFPASPFGYTYIPT